MSLNTASRKPILGGVTSLNRKVIMYEVLKLKQYVPQYERKWFSKISTTTNPKTDWCGFMDGGVVDIQVDTEEGEVL